MICNLFTGHESVTVRRVLFFVKQEDRVTVLFRVE